MIVGVPKEVKDHETRAGATIVPFASEVRTNADLVVKVKEPQASVVGYLRLSRFAPVPVVRRPQSILQETERKCDRRGGMAWTRLFLVALVGASFASAETITVTESAIATGSLGSSAFDDSLITLTATGDTSNVVGTGLNGANFKLENLSILVNIAGLGSADLTDEGLVFSNQNTGAGGFSDPGKGDILDTFDSAFDTYALATSFGPITDTGSINAGFAFSTNQGSFVINSITGDATYTATVLSPEPSAVSLFGFGLAGLATLKRRR